MEFLDVSDLYQSAPWPTADGNVEVFPFAEVLQEVTVSSVKVPRHRVQPSLGKGSGFLACLEQTGAPLACKIPYADISSLGRKKTGMGVKGAMPEGKRRKGTARSPWLTAKNLLPTSTLGPCSSLARPPARPGSFFVSVPAGRRLLCQEDSALSPPAWSVGLYPLPAPLTFRRLPLVPALPPWVSSFLQPFRRSALLIVHQPRRAPA